MTPLLTMNILRFFDVTAFINSLLFIFPHELYFTRMDVTQFFVCVVFGFEFRPLLILHKSHTTELQCQLWILIFFLLLVKAVQ
jgi:hypothetical protein